MGRHESEEGLRSPLAELADALRRAVERGEGEVSIATADPALAEITALVNQLVAARAANATATDLAVAKQQQAVLKYIIANVPHSIFWKDRDGRFLGGNDNLLRDLGVRSSDEFIGRTDYDFFPREQADFFRKCDADVMEQGRPLLDIEEPQSQSGGQHTLLTSKVPLRDDEGRVTGMLGIYADITERKRMEEDLRAARDAAETAAKAKSDFLAIMSHELRTPLALILGPIDFILSGEPQLPGTVRTDLERVRRNAQRLLELVNDILDFARLEAGRMEIEWELVDPGAVLADVVESARPAAQSARIDLSLATSGITRPIALDRRKLEKIAYNLVGNAIKFTPAGGRIAVALRIDGSGLLLSVADTGPGIPADKIPLLFRRFQQVEGTATRKHEGTGIGLALVRELAELMGGRALVESEPGVGSTFTVQLPLVAESVAVAAAQRAEPTAPPSALLRPSDEVRPAPTRPNTPRVLIAEDSAEMRDYLHRILDEEFTVESYENGALALEAARRSPPEVIVSDVMMPVMDGHELVSRLKADPLLRHVPVILLTARAARKQLVAALDLGADDYLGKPFHAAELKARIEAARRLHRLYLELDREHAQLVAAHGELKEAQRSLVHAAKVAAVGTLVAGLSHELNNPLSIILMNTQALLGERNPSTERLAKSLLSIEKHTRRCARLVESLLDFARKKQSGREPIAASRLISRVLELAAIKAKRCDVALTRKGGGVADPVDAPAEVADEPDLLVCVQDVETAVLNLVNNALDATPRGGEVELSLARVDLGGSFIELRVRDSGSGIAPDVLPHIFDPFFTTKPVGQGTGLGLSLTRKIVQDHGGEIEIDSSVGAGTTVVVRLPALDTTGDGTAHGGVGT